MAADSSTSVRTGHELTKQDFDRLLVWLDQDREKAAQKYEEIRIRLTKVFESRGCMTPEELADETIDRVARKIHEVAATYQGEPVLYFHGVARLVYLEYSRRPSFPYQPESNYRLEETDQRYDCLDECLLRLTPGNRELILLYYGEERRTKIDARKTIARRLGVSPNALRIRAHRIKECLGDCINNCLALKGQK